MSPGRTVCKTLFSANAAAQASPRNGKTGFFFAPVRHRDSDKHLIESLRAVLAIIASLLMLETPSQGSSPLMLAVVGFCLYAALILWLTASRQPLPLRRAHHWLDACWFLLLIALAGSFGVRYFIFLFFPVLFASWRQGIGESIAVAALSSLASCIVLNLSQPTISWVILLLLPLSLLVTGSLMAVLARTEFSIRQGGAFASWLVERADPRRGFEAMMPSLIKSVALEFGAAGALLVTDEFDGSVHVLCWEAAEGCTRLPQEAAKPFLEHLSAFPPNKAFFFRPCQRAWCRQRVKALLMPEGTVTKAVAGERANLAVLAKLLDQPCLAMVPLPCRSVGCMRLILTGTANALRSQDLDVLAHVAEQLGPPVENALLLERLASEAVENERSRIGRDLHDSAIQPYIGLKFAVEALARQAEPGNPLFKDLQNLQEMATEELAIMRDVVSKLRGNPGRGGALLASAVKRQALRFEQLFGVKVNVEIDGALPVSRRIAGELFHIVAEGLSNIRRHTRARQAWIQLGCQDSELNLRIRNEHGSATPASGFTPGSLSERAAELGGITTVETDAEGCTVTVKLPLEQGGG